MTIINIASSMKLFYDVNRIETENDKRGSIIPRKTNVERGEGRCKTEWKRFSYGWTSIV